MEKLHTILSGESWLSHGGHSRNTFHLHLHVCFAWLHLRHAQVIICLSQARRLAVIFISDCFFHVSGIRGEGRGCIYGKMKSARFLYRVCRGRLGMRLMIVCRFSSKYALVRLPAGSGGVCTSNRVVEPRRTRFFAALTHATAKCRVVIITVRHVDISAEVSAACSPLWRDISFHASSARSPQHGHDQGPR